MLNYLWAGMIIIGIVYGAFTGKMPDITNAALDSAKEAVTLCITMVGVMAFWMGIMEIASRAGIIEMASKKMRPLIRFLFPDIPKEHQANQYITTNFIANFLGLGWAATPAGLQGMQALAELEQERRGIQRNVHISDHEYLFAAVDPDQCDRLPESVWKYESGGNCRCVDCGDNGEYAGRDGVL